MRKFLLVLLVVGFGVFGATVNAQKKPYNNLIFTEVRLAQHDIYGYCELTNMGTETIDLSEFELMSVGSYAILGIWYIDDSFRFPKKMLAPGKSYVLAAAFDEGPRRWFTDPVHNRERITPPEMYRLADYMIDMPESETAGDSVSSYHKIFEQADCLYLKHIYMIDGVQDSMIIDQVGGVFDEPDGTQYDRAYDVAGVTGATRNSVLIRKAKVHTGITEFSNHDANLEAARMQFANNRGLDIAESEWIPVPVQSGDASWRSVFWTVGNQGNYILDANTLVPKTTGKIKVDLDKATINVPWGIRDDDSIMVQMVRKPGLAWQYSYAPTKEDSAFISARTGDKLTLYVCGNDESIKTFSIVVSDPTPSDNTVIPKSNFGYRGKMKIALKSSSYNLTRIRVTDGVSGMDTISNITFANRVDTLYKYLEKAPKASWKIIPKDGKIKPDLQFGDKLLVTAENGNTKEYFLKVANYLANENAFLSSITWPDMPSYFKGDIARFYGWKGDTIPGFSPSVTNYVVKIPAEYQGIPALIFSKQNLNANVVVKRATNLSGTPDDGTVTFTVTAENGTTKNIYSVRLDQEKDPLNIQPYKAKPYISQVVDKDEYLYPWLEIANPGTEPIDLSNYMIMSGMGNIVSSFDTYNTIDDWTGAFCKYVPGKKWQDIANWMVQPRLLETDLGTNSILAPGEVFVMNAKEPTPNDAGFKINFNFRHTPWGTNVVNEWDQCAIRDWGRSASTIYLLKITNDSVINGLKPATDFNDFELIDVFGYGEEKTWIVGGTKMRGPMGITRKPNIYKGNTQLGASFGTNPDDSEWTILDVPTLVSLGYTEWDNYKHVTDGIGSQVMDPVTVNRSTVTSLVYKVSPGYSQEETIRGLTTGTIVTDFYNKLIKANPLQTLKVKSAGSGNELAEASEIGNGDKLLVLSADSTNTSTYTLDVTVNGLSSNAVLTSSKYTINTTGTTGTIGGFDQGTLLKTVVDNVVVPAGATLTLTDKNDAYMTFMKLNYDTAYVNVIASDEIYFEVVAENGTTTILYQLTPTSNPSDAYVTSDVYSVDQFASLINFVPGGTSVPSLISNVTPAPGAKIVVYDKAGFVRETGSIYRDDKLVVTSADGTASKAYYFSMLNFHVNTYFAYVISDEYIVNQLAYTIVGPKSPITFGEFYGKLYPSFGATLKVLDKNGNPSTAATLQVGDKLMVTAADGVTNAVYQIDLDNTKVVDPNAATIKMYPNPTTDRVIIHGLAKGNRVQVINAAGITLRDVIVDNPTEYVSLSAQPAGIYIFVISSGIKHISIQKIIKE